MGGDRGDRVVRDWTGTLARRTSKGATGSLIKAPPHTGAPHDYPSFRWKTYMCRSKLKQAGVAQISRSEARIRPHHFEPEVRHLGDGLLSSGEKRALALQERLVNQQHLQKWRRRGGPHGERVKTDPFPRLILLGDATPMKRARRELPSMLP